MNSFVVVPSGARLSVRRLSAALGLGVLAILPTPCLAAQPLLPRATLRTLSLSEQPAPGALPASVPIGTAREVDPYPGTRREGAIHRAPELTSDIIGWVALGRVVWSSGYDQVAGSPKSWPRTSESYGRRFATRSAQLVTIEVVRHGAAAALDRDPAYVKCACSGFGPRLGHVTKAVVTDFDEDGVRRIGWPRFAGALAGAIMLGQLQPGQGSAGTVAYRALTTVAGSFVGNAVKEIGLFGTAKAKQDMF